MARKIIPVYFNDETESELIEFIKNKNFSGWVKEKIKAELITEKSTEIDQKVVSYINRVIETRILEAKLFVPIAEQKTEEFEDENLKNNALNCF